MNRLLASQYRIAWIATSIILANTVCAAFAMVTLSDVQYTSAASVPIPQQSHPTASRLVFRSQKGLCRKYFLVTNEVFRSHSVKR